jgi:predicted RNase H-like HicB family nuclease
MTESIQLVVTLRGILRREGKRWACGCPALDVWSQGSSVDDAKRSLHEAVELWFEDCLARGVLERALQEVGFRPAPSGMVVSEHEQAVRIVKKKVRDETILGSPFDLSVSIPAYQAAAFLGEQVGQ